MISLQETTDVARARHEVFAYVADFSRTPEWDATAVSARTLTAGPVAEGTVFAVRCALPLGSVLIHYTVTRFEPDALIELRGECRWFDNVDTITLEDTEAGTRLHYKATFHWRGLLQRLEHKMQPGMARMGQASVEGLRRALEDSPHAPTASPGAERADRWVLPGILRFSRLGIRCSRKHWQPMSAWLGDKQIVITGANSGLGLATAIGLARLGAQLTLVIRNPDKASDLRETLRCETGRTDMAIEVADLAVMADVDALAQRLLARALPIDVLVNNAGALFNPRQETRDGLEQSFALLLLSPYRLTMALQPLLARASGSRVVNVVSGGMYTAKLDVPRLQAPPQAYSGAQAYAHCKRALMVITEQWAEEWQDLGITVNAMHPGWADTPGVVTSLPGFHRLTRPILRSPEEGADTIVWLAAAPEAALVTGKLFLDREPHTTHLRAGTRETQAERQALRQYLDSVWPPAPTA